MNVKSEKYLRATAGAPTALDVFSVAHALVPCAIAWCGCVVTLVDCELDCGRRELHPLVAAACAAQGRLVQSARQLHVDRGMRCGDGIAVENPGRSWPWQFASMDELRMTPGGAASNMTLTFGVEPAVNISGSVPTLPSWELAFGHRDFHESAECKSCGDHLVTRAEAEYTFKLAFAIAVATTF